MRDDRICLFVLLSLVSFFCSGAGKQKHTKESRIRRIARGSGRHPRDVEELLHTFNEMAKRFKQGFKGIPKSAAMGGKMNQATRLLSFGCSVSLTVSPHSATCSRCPRPCRRACCSSWAARRASSASCRRCQERSEEEEEAAAAEEEAAERANKHSLLTLQLRAAQLAHPQKRRLVKKRTFSKK